MTRTTYIIISSGKGRLIYMKPLFLSIYFDRTKLDSYLNTNLKIKENVKRLTFGAEKYLVSNANRYTTNGYLNIIDLILFNNKNH